MPRLPLPGSPPRCLPRLPSAFATDGIGAAYNRTNRWHVTFRERTPQVAGILWAVLAVVLVIWLIGLVLGTVGSLIHILLIVAAIILIYNLWSGRRV